jgi:BMFP domain-containing protein YqiC
MSSMPTPNESAEDVTRRASTTLALLIRLAEAEQRGDRGGTNAELDAEAWSAIEDLLITTRNDVKRLDQEITQLEDAQRTAKAKSGAR